MSRQLFFTDYPLSKPSLFFDTSNNITYASKLLSHKSSKKLVGFDISPPMLDSFIIINHNTTLRDASTNQFILSYHTNLIPSNILDPAIHILQKHAPLSPFRGEASGKADISNILQFTGNVKNIIVQNYSTSKSWTTIKRISTGSVASISNYVKSGNIGFYKRKTHGIRIPPPPPTPIKNLLHFIGDYLLSTHPNIYNCYTHHIPPHLRYGGSPSPFTTITINKDFQTSMHFDKGNFGFEVGDSYIGDAPPAISCLTSSYIGDESYSGSYLCFPQYGVAVPLQKGDFLIANTNLLHGNSPIIYPSTPCSRISLVFYIRKNLIECV